jgi:hypothetical protein
MPQSMSPLKALKAMRSKLTAGGANVDIFTIDPVGQLSAN